MKADSSEVNEKVKRKVSAGVEQAKRDVSIHVGTHCAASMAGTSRSALVSTLGARS